MLTHIYSKGILTKQSIFGDAILIQICNKMIKTAPLLTNENILMVSISFPKKRKAGEEN